MQMFVTRIAENILKMDSLKGKYTFGSVLTKEIQDLGAYGHVGNADGEFIFKECKMCKGPMLGHTVQELECTGAPLKTDVNAEIWQFHNDNILFQTMVTMMDTNPNRCNCDQCRTTLSNHFELQQHMRKVHTVAKKTDGSDLNMQDAMSLLIISNDRMSNCLAKMNDRHVAKESVQVTKAKFVPEWNKTDFERWKTDVMAWSNHNKDEDYMKCQDLIESLKKNKGVTENVLQVVLDST
jgi:hypothetical protein